MPRFLQLSVPLAAILFAAPLFAQPLVYVTDPSANSLKAVNSGNNTIVRTVPALTGARAIAVSADGSRVYVAASGTGSNGEVAVIDGTKVRDPNADPVIAEIRVGGKPVATAYDALTGLLYAADAKNNQAASYDLGSVDPAHPDPVATYQAGGGLNAMALAPDGKTLALASTDAPQVALYNLRRIAAGLKGKTVVSLASKPRALAFSARGDELWIATAAGFSVYSLATGIVSSFALSGGTTAIAVAPRTARVYFGAGTGNVVYAYTPGDGTVSNIGVYGPVSGLSLSADGTRLYATQNCDGCGLAVVSTVTDKALTQVRFGSGPRTAGGFTGPGNIYAPNATTGGQVEEQLSGTVSASDYASRPLSYSVITAPAAGTLAFNATGDFAYTPPPGLSGRQAFVWEASAASGDGSPNEPLSRPITETLEIRPSVSAIADQQADPDSTLGPLAFTLDGSAPFAIVLKSSDGGLVNAGKIGVSAGCGETSLNCSLSIPVEEVPNGTTTITLKAIDPDGLVAKTKFKVVTGNGNGSGGGGGFAAAGLGGLLLFALAGALIRRRRGRI